MGVLSERPSCHCASIVSSWSAAAALRGSMSAPTSGRPRPQQQILGKACLACIHVETAQLGAIMHGDAAPVGVNPVAAQDGLDHDAGHVRHREAMQLARAWQCR